MKNKILIFTVIVLSSFGNAGDIGGYTIFQYSDQTKGFDINRVYFQYTDDLSDDLFLKIRYDLDRPDGKKLYGYLKNVYVDWESESGSIFTFGLLGTNSFGIQEKTWGHRFIAKTAVDYWEFVNTADFGVGYSHSFAMFNINVQLTNGDGYKKNGNENSALATSFRLMYGESALNKNDGYNIGIVMVSLPDNYYDNQPDKNLIGIFGGWSGNNIRFGLEHNSYDIGNQTEIVKTFYMNYSLDNWNFFLRQDMWENIVGSALYGADIDVADPDESKTYLGATWNPTKGLYISPNLVKDREAEIKDEIRISFMFKY